MSAARRDDDLLEQIAALVRAYSLRHWGQLPTHFAIVFPGGLEHRELLPPALGPPETLPASPASGPARPLDEECRRFYWPELGVLRFSKKQAAVVRALWESDEAGGVEQGELLGAAGSDGDRLRDLFRSHPAWGVMIVPGGPGRYRLAEAATTEDE